MCARGALMNYESNSARVCRAMCHVGSMVSLHESPNLYGFVRMCAICATYLIKLFNKRITALASHGVMAVTSLNSLTKLRNLVAQVARVAQITKYQGDI